MSDVLSRQLTVHSALLLFKSASYEEEKTLGIGVLTQPSEVTQRHVAFLVLRVAVGLSLTGHGLVRIPKLGAFRDSMSEQFTSSIIPADLVSLAASALPIAELIVGVMIILGVATFIGLIGGSVLMISLIFGSTTIEDWPAIGDQLLHTFPLVALLASSRFNAYSVDHLLLQVCSPIGR